jgi:hypothetical protein
MSVAPLPLGGEHASGIGAGLSRSAGGHQDPFAAQSPAARCSGSLLQQLAIREALAMIEFHHHGARPHLRHTALSAAMSTYTSTGNTHERHSRTRDQAPRHGRSG